MLVHVQDEKMSHDVLDMIDRAYNDDYFKNAFSNEYVPGQGLREEVTTGIVASTDKEGNIVGCFIYSHSIFVNKVTGITAFNFKKRPSIPYAKDIEAFCSFLFDTLKAHKVNWCANVGSATEKLQDKIVKKYHGRIIGVYKDDAAAADGKIYDVKEYEIMRADYLKFVEEREEKKNVRNHQG